MSWDVAQLLNEDYSKWASGRTDAIGIPMQRIFDALGSKTNPGPLRNTETHLNSLKGRVRLSLILYHILIIAKEI